MNNYPKLHNAMWPGLVGKGPGSEPFIDLDTMLDLTASAASNGVRFDGVDLFLADPHTSIDSTDDQLKGLADNIASRKLVVGSVIAPVWPPTGGGSAMGGPEERHRFVEQVRKAARLAKSCANWGSDRMESFASIPQPIPRVGLVIRTARRKLRRLFASVARLRKIMANVWLPKARSAGAGCTVGEA